MSSWAAPIRAAAAKPLSWSTSQLSALHALIDAVLDIAVGYAGAQGPYLEGVRADEMQPLLDALARFGAEVVPDTRYADTGGPADE